MRVLIVPDAAVFLRQILSEEDYVVDRRMCRMASSGDKCARRARRARLV